MTSAATATSATRESATEFGGQPVGERASAPQRRPRIASLDIVRGVVMLLMAIDHVRVFSGLPAGGPTPGIFFTRWITHFVAPAFVFLAGTSAFLYGERVGSVARLSRFLLTRGAWLVFLELTVLRVAWTFNFDFAHYLLAGVIWMIGWCMILMAAIIHLRRRVILVASLVIIAGHNASAYISGAIDAIGNGRWGWLLQVVYTGGWIPMGKDGVFAVLFVIIPWIAVMAAGYTFGDVVRMAPERRRRFCMRLGVACVAAFVVLRAINVYGDPRPWSAPSARVDSVAATSTAPSAAAASHGAHGRESMPVALSFLNTSKYPASLQFLLMTLGPMFILLALVDGARGPIARVLETYGRVPFFYYVLHIPLIHLAAVVVSLVREHTADAWLFTNHPMANPPPPPGYTWSLPLLYVVWLVVILVLYPLCRWYGGLKQRSHSVLLSYL